MRCNVCISPHRDAIDDALEKGEVQRHVAERYGLNPSSISRHLSQKHPRAVPLSEIGDEPVLPSYGWVRKQANARGKTVRQLLALSVGHDPFYLGSPSDHEQAKWFKKLLDEFGKDLSEKDRYLRYLHYRSVVAVPKPVWPNGEEYINTETHWFRLSEYSRPARWLEYVDPESFDDRRNAPPVYNSQELAYEEEPALASPEWTGWRMPTIHSGLYTPDWGITRPSLSGYDEDKYLDQPSMVGIFIEKSTMDSWLQPLCVSLDVDLYVGSGYQSITNALRFVRRAVELKKPAHLYVISDHDPQGDRMPLSASRHVQYRLRQRFPNAEITVDALALTPEQIKKWKLPRVPIKDSNLMREGFEALHGEGAVELDALEALRPGELQAIVRKAVLAHRDASIQERLEDARLTARAALDDQWDATVKPIETLVMATRKKAMAIAYTYSETLSKLNAELQAKLKPYRRQMEKLERQAKEAVLELEELKLPNRPRPMVAEDKASHLFDWRRSYFEQLAAFHEVSPPPKERR